MRNNNIGGFDSKKSVASFLALLSFTAYMPVSCIPAFADISSTALPDLNKAVNGDVNVRENTNVMDVSVKGGKGTVGQFDWNTFNVGKDAQVNWVFNANNQTALNRVLATGGMSYIYGKLTNSSANPSCNNCVNTSKVILINPAGIMFGNGSSVDLNSFTASTFDIRNAKNLQDLSAEQLKDYAGTGGETGQLFDIAGYNKTVSFVSNDNFVDGNGYITANASGTRLASIVAGDANGGSNIYGDKTVAFVGNKIDITNGTHIASKYGSEDPNSSNGTQNRSTVKIVTGDGINFYYTSQGNAQNSNVNVTSKTATTAGKDYGISIADSEIRAGNVLIQNAVQASNSDLKIDNSTIYSKKLLGTTFTSGGVKYDETQTGVDGNLTIKSDNTLTIKDSNVQTTNDGTLTDPTTAKMGYGNMEITSKGDMLIQNTQLRSADSALNTDSSNITAGNIKIESTNGKVDLVQNAPTNSELYNNTGIVAGGDLTIKAKTDVKVDKYNKIQAKGYRQYSDKYAANVNRTINIQAENVELNGTLVNAQNLNVDANKKIDVKGADVVATNTKLHGTDTTIDNSLMQYSSLSFHDKDAKTNNVTIKNNTTFNDISTDGLKISTNGNLTLDNAKLQNKAYGSTDAATNQKSIALESTKGNVTIQNKSNVQTANGNLTVSANNGAINVTGASSTHSENGKTELTAKNNINVTGGSTVWAKNGDMNVTSTAGKLVANNSTIVAEGGNTTVSQALSMDIDNDLKGSYIGTSNKLTLMSNGDIVSNLGIQDGQQLETGTGYINDYKNLISLNNDATETHLVFKDALMQAGNDITITDIASADNVDFVAGNNITLASTVGMDLTNVSTNAGKSTNIAAKGDLTTDGFEIKGGDKTTLTGSTVKTKGDSVIKTNGKKLAVNGDGAIDIAVTGVNDTNNGLEINADVNTSAGSAPLAGKTVKVNAKDGTLAIAKIKADTLDLTADTILAAKTTISAANDNINGDDGLVASGENLSSKAYIEIKTDGGFNLDRTTTYGETGNVKYNDTNYGSEEVSKNTTHTPRTETKDKENVTYGERYVSSEINETSTKVGDPKVSETTTTEVVDILDDDGNKIGEKTITHHTEKTEQAYATEKVDTYQGTKTTSTTTTTTTYDDWETTTVTREGQHIATLNDQQENGFVLVYGKTKTDVTNGSDKTGTNEVTSEPVTVDWGGTLTRVDTTYDGTSAENVKIKTSERKWDTFENCFDEDILDPDLGGMDVASYARIPRHIEGTSDVANYQNNLADTTSTVVAAAARLQLDDADNAEKTSDDDDSFIIE